MRKDSSDAVVVRPLYEVFGSLSDDLGMGMDKTGLRMRSRGLVLVLICLIAGAGLATVGFVVLSSDPYGGRCPSELWAAQLAAQATQLAPDDAGEFNSFTGDCDGQRATIGTFATPSQMSTKQFCDQFRDRAVSAGWTVTPEMGGLARSSRRYCPLIAQKQIESRQAYISMGPTEFYAAPHRLDGYN